MRTHRAWWLAAAFTAGAVAFGLIPSGLTEESNPNPLKIGVVNLRQVFTESRRSKEFEIQIGKEKSAEEAELRGFVDRIEKIKAQIKELEAAGGKPELLKEKRCMLVELAARVKFREEEWNAEVGRRISAHTVTLFNDVTEAMNSFGREQGYDLIMRIETGPIAPSPDESVNERIARRMILYANPAIDITKEIQTRFEPPSPPEGEDKKQ